MISGRQLAVIISVWLRDLPRWVWGDEPGYAKLKAQRRETGPEPDGRMMAAKHVAAELERLGWEVSYPEPGQYTNITTKGGAATRPSAAPTKEADQQR
jgi:hypothetical protein